MIVRTLLYARFSDADLQNSRSIEDQIRLLRERADREGWPIVEIFTDYGISGAAGIESHQRPGLSALLARVEQGGVDQVLAESTDRIARHQGDSFTIRERLQYAGCRLFTLLDGEVDDIKGTFKGLFDARFRQDLAARIKRGQRGTVGQGRSPAGLAYGYRLANRIEAGGRIVRGLREIDPDQAEIVRRIFEEYAAGRSARMIAERLNQEGVPGPRGGTWRLSTIAGDRKRQNGMLQNRLYAGVLVHNRTSKITDPRTREVRIRPNPADQWISQPVPELRIVSDDLWERVQASRNSHAAERPEYSRRPKHLLSGLVVCGVCGGAFNVISNSYWGCGKHTDGRGCSNNRRIRQDLLEQRTLAGLTRHMLDPDAVSAYVRAYHNEYAREAAQIARERAKLERRHAEADARLRRLVGAVAAGGDDFVEIREMLGKVRADRDALAAELANLEALPVVALHPNIERKYREDAAALAESLKDPEASLEAVPKIRDLIERVLLTPATEGRGCDVEVQGSLHAIIALAMGVPVSVPSPLTVTVERVKGSGRYRRLSSAKV